MYTGISAKSNNSEFAPFSAVVIYIPVVFRGGEGKRGSGWEGEKKVDNKKPAKTNPRKIGKRFKFYGKSADKDTKRFEEIPK